MTFVSLPFACLFIITAFLYWKVKSINSRHMVLLVASYIFYAWWDVRFLALLVGQTFVSYYLGLLIEKSSSIAAKKRLCAVGIIVSLVVLGFFKYFNFFRDAIISVCGLRASDAINIILPVGISFYTFQAMSYLIDVYRGVIVARKKFVEVSLYISFFPQLVAGPIVRAKDFLPQLDINHEITSDNVEKAVQIFLIGMFKKCVIADRLAVCVDAVYRSPKAYDGISLVCASLAYIIQLYCDFSGYSDMAIGTAKFFGFDLCINFDLPFLSKNPSDLWRRWHISLSSWLKDYLYIPLGGNRKGTRRTYINLLITMTLGGLWHGADWTFVAWGLFNGVGLCICRIYQKQIKKYIIKHESKMLDVLSIIGTLVFFVVGCIFFRSQSFGDAFSVLNGILTWQSGVHYIYVYTMVYGIILFIAHVLIYIKNNGHYNYPMVSLKTWKGKFVICFEAMLIFLLAYGGNTAFVYFQF